MDETRTSRAKILRDWLRAFLLAFLVVMPFRSAVADWNDVPTGSMRPTILEGERIFVNKLAYDLKLPFTTWHLAEWGDPRRGDVVVCFSPADGRRLVKRVVAVPGDVVALRANQLWINGERARYEPVRRPPGVGGDDLLARERVAGRAHLVQFRPERPAPRAFRRVTVPPDRYLLLGDNRDASADSRWFGFVRRDQIVGEAIGIVSSFEPDALLCPRWERWLSGLE